MTARRKTQCPLTTSSRLRAQANRQSAAIQSQFPSGLSQPALRALASAGYTRLDQLTKVKAVDLARLHGLGPQGIRILSEALQARGKRFAR